MPLGSRLQQAWHSHCLAMAREGEVEGGRKLQHPANFVQLVATEATQVRWLAIAREASISRCAQPARSRCTQDKVQHRPPALLSSCWNAALTAGGKMLTANMLGYW